MEQQHIKDLQSQSQQLLQSTQELNSYLHSASLPDLKIISYKLGVLRMQTMKLHDYLEFVKQHINDQNQGGILSNKKF